MSYETEVLADAPVGYWKLDETSGTTVADTSGFGTTLNIIGSPTLGDIAPPPGMTGMAPTMKTNDTFQTVTGVEYSPGNDITIEYWIKNPFFYNDGTVAFSLGNNDAERCQSHCPWTNGTLYWDFGSTSIGRSTGPFTAYADPTEWTHVVLVGDRSNNPIFVNGVDITDTYSSQSPAIFLQGLIIGNYYGFVPYLNMCHFAVYDYALSTGRIEDHYAAGIASGGGGTEALAATIAGTSSITAALRARARSTATIAGVGTFTPVPRVRARLSSTLAGAGGPSATLRARARLSGTIAAAGVFSASFDATVALSAIIAGVGTVTGTIRARRRLAASVAGAGALTSTARARSQMAVTIAGSGTLTVAPLRLRARLAVSLVGAAVLTPNLRRRSRLVVAIAGVGTLVTHLNTAARGEPQPRRAPTGGRIGRPSAGRLVRSITGRIR